MSRTTALGIRHNQRPTELAIFRNAWGWSPSIWSRLLTARGQDPRWWVGSNDGPKDLWEDIENMPDWQAVPLVLTFDTGVVPFQTYRECADLLDEFERRCPADASQANHVPAVAALLRSAPQFPWFGVWGTSVSDNPFDPWDDDLDEPGEGIPIGPGSVYVLEIHRRHIPGNVRATGNTSGNTTDDQE